MSSGLAALTFTYGYAHQFGIGWYALDHVWSLCIEEHSYLLLLFVAVITARIMMKVSRFLFIISVISICDGLFRALYLKESYFQTYWSSDAALQFITVPTLIYLFRERISLLFTPVAQYITPVLLLFVIVLYYHRVPFYVTGTAAPLMLGVAITLLPLANAAFIDFLEHKILTVMGLWSFSIYIWQQPFMVLSAGDSTVVRFGFMIIAILIGILSYYGIERPVRLFINRQLAARKAMQPAH